MKITAKLTKFSEQSTIFLCGPPSLQILKTYESNRKLIKFSAHSTYFLYLHIRSVVDIFPHIL